MIQIEKTSEKSKIFYNFLFLLHYLPSLILQKRIDTMFFEDEKNTNDSTTPQEEIAAQVERDIAKMASIEESFKEQFLRLNADFQNFKRRVEKERAEWMTSAQSSVLKKLLPVFDELDNVVLLTKGEQATDNTSWTQGLQLSQKNWQKILLEIGVEEIDPSGMFDPELHEGLMQEEALDKKSGEIVKTFSKGYRFKGNVIKHAKVSVAK